MTYAEITLILLALFVLLGGIAYVASFFLDQVLEAFDDETLSQRGEGRCETCSGLACKPTDAPRQRGNK
jgi:hypothetical protein